MNEIIKDLLRSWIAETGTLLIEKKEAEVRKLKASVAHISFKHGDYSQAARLYEESLQVYTSAAISKQSRKIGDDAEALETMYQLGKTLIKLGRYGEATNTFRMLSSKYQVDSVEHLRTKKMIATTLLEQDTDPNNAVEALTILRACYKSLLLLADNCRDLFFQKGSEFYPHKYQIPHMEQLIGNAIRILFDCNASETETDLQEALQYLEKGLAGFRQCGDRENNDTLLLCRYDHAKALISANREDDAMVELEDIFIKRKTENGADHFKTRQVKKDIMRIAANK